MDAGLSPNFLHVQNNRNRHGNRGYPCQLKLNYMKKLYSILLFSVVTLPCMSQINSLRYNNGDSSTLAFSNLNIWPIYYYYGFDYSSINENDVSVNDLYFKLDSLIKLRDELRIQYQIDSISGLYNYINRDRENTNYFAWYLSLGLVFSDFKELNNRLQDDNIDALNSVSANAIWILGFSWKRKRLIQSAYLELSLPNSVEKNDLKLLANGVSLANYDLGWAIIDNRRIHLYPYAGLFWKSSLIRMENKINSGGQAINDAPSFSDVLNSSDAFAQEYNFTYRKNEIGLNLGVELDYHIKYNDGKGGGLAIGIKFGLNNPIIQTGWRLDKKPVSDIPDFYFKRYYTSLVFKVL